MTEFERTFRPRPTSARRDAWTERNHATHVPPIVDAVLRTPGQPLDAAARAYFEPRFGHDFSQVRVHADPAAAVSARAVDALAYTVGRDVVFDHERYAPATAEGRSLLAHELTHVVQQDHGAPGRRVLRQVSGRGLGPIGPLTGMTDQQLQDRYDAITEYFLAAKQSTIGDEKLQSEAGEIGAILAARAGRTFDASQIARMRAFFEANARAPKPKSCIATLNEGVKLVLGEPKQKTAGSVDETAGRLQGSGRAGPAREVGFLDARGRPTEGTLSPVRLRESVWDALIGLAGGDRGWSVFVMSLMDGYHSVTLSLDNTDPAKPRIFWSDQWSTKGGFMEYTKATLDAEIEHLTHAWWEEEAAGTGESALKTGRAVRMNTVVRLYRLSREPRHVGPPPVSRPVQPAPLPLELH
jgi:Domain of unknown function (DUF4157)